MVIVAFLIFIVGIAWIFSKALQLGPGMLVVAFAFAGLMSFAGYWWGDKIVLATLGARPADRNREFEFYTVAENLSIAAQLPKPALFVIDDPSPNAFATGRDPEHAVVCATTGLIQKLDRTELEGVIAHELSHIRNRDILIATIAATIAGAVTMLAYWGRFAAIFGGFGRDDDERGGIIGLLIMAIVAPVAALLIQLAISRSREYAADRAGAKLAGTPHGLASALEKLESYAKRRPVAVSPSTAHLFIVNPLRAGFMTSLFSTHPATERRVERLRRMAIV